MDSVGQVGGCPAKVRTDCGTENVVLAAIQTTIVGRGAHAYGTSPSIKPTHRVLVVVLLMVSLTGVD